MTVLFRADFQNTLTPEVGTYDNTSEKTGSFGLDGGEYYLQNSPNTKGYYFYYLASGSDNSKLTITFDIALINSSSSGWSVLFSGSDSNWWGLFTSGNTFSLNTRSEGDTSLGSYSTSTWYTVKITQEVSLGVLKVKLYIDDVEKADIRIATNYAITNLLLLGNTSTSWTADGTVLKNFLITDGEEEEEPTPSGVLKYLNFTGLSNLVTNIKNWVTARIPTKTSEITNDSGFITSHQTVSNSAPTLAWGATSTIGSVGGTNLTVTMPANPNTDTDTKVSQTVTISSDTYYPLLFCNTAKATATETSGAKFNSGVAANARYGYFWLRNLYNTDNLKGQTAGGNRICGGMRFNSYDDAESGRVWNEVLANGTRQTYIRATNYITDGALAADGTATHTLLRLRVYNTGAKKIYCDGGWENNLIPDVTNTRTLGTSSLAWKGIYSNSYYLGTTAFGDIVTHNASEYSLVSHTHTKSEITDFPIIPTVNNATLTIQKNSSNVATFTANASSNVTANITVPTKVSELTNDNRYIPCLNPANLMGFDWSTQYPGKIGIKVDSTWLGGILTTANTTIPTKTSDLTNDSGFLTSSALSTNFVTTDTTQTISGQKTWTGNNTFSAGVLTGLIDANPGNTGLLLRSTDQTWENGARVFLYSNTQPGQTNGSIYVDVDHGDGNNTKTGLILVPNAFLPAGGGTYGVSLGTSTNQWKSVYANSYYLGNTQFGDIVTHNASEFLTSHQSLSDYVTLNTQQNISANKFFYGGAWRIGSNYPSFICKNNTHTVGEAAPSSMWGYGEFLIQDKNAYSVCLLSCRYDQNATQYFRIECRNKFTNGAPAVNGTAISSVLDVGTLADSTRYIYWNSYISNGLIPRIAFAWNIGDGNYPWNIVYASNYKIKSANTQIGVTTSNSTVDFIDLIDANNTQVGYIGRWQHNNGYSCINLTCYDKYDGAGNRSTSGTVANGTLEIGVSNTGVPYLNYNTYFMQNVTPLTNDNNDLGDTSHHWRNLFIGETHCYHQNALMSKSGSYTFLLRNDGSYIWFLISEANGNEGTWSGLRPLYINCANGACTTTSTWNFNKSFGDGDPSVLIQSGTEYANGTWNYPLSALAPNMKAGSNLFMPIGRSHSTGNCAGWHFYYAGNNSNDNFLSVEFYASGSPLAVYRDGRVMLSGSPAASDNSNRVATTAFVKANTYTHPTSAGNKHIPSGGSTGQILRYSAAGTAAWANRGAFVSIATRSIPSLTSTGSDSWTITTVANCIYLLKGSFKLSSSGASITIHSKGRIVGGYGTFNSTPGTRSNTTIYNYNGESTNTTYYFVALIWATDTSLVILSAGNLTTVSMDFRT